MPSKNTDENQYHDYISGLKTAIEELKKIESTFKEQYSINSIRYSPKLVSISQNPLEYLGEKLEIPSCTSVDQLKSKVKGNRRLKSVLTTTISANIRSIYEAWVLLSLMVEMDGKITYPTNGKLYLTQNSDLKNDYVAIMEMDGNQKIAFFLEGTISSKNNVNPHSGGLRPDIVLVRLEKDLYGSGDLQYDISFSFEDILSIIECKESTSWPWTTKRIYNPLKDTREKIKVTHLEMLKYYSEIFEPSHFFVVSKLSSPARAVNEISNEDIKLLDEVNFNRNRLSDLVKEIKKDLQ